MTRVCGKRIGIRVDATFFKVVALGLLSFGMGVSLAEEIDKDSREEKNSATPEAATVSVYGVELPPHVNSMGMRFVGKEGVGVRIGVHEVTVGQFAAYEKQAGTSRKLETLHFQQDDNHPVVNINLEDAEAFCAWLTKSERGEGILTDEQHYRLPTNEEWSLAAGLYSELGTAGELVGRIDEESRYPWGDIWPPPMGAGNFAATEIPGYEDAYRFTAPVGSFFPTNEGIHDLSGNVWEWTKDFDQDTGSIGTLRGGSWIYFQPDYLRAAYRYRVPSDMRASTFGFRCVFDDKALREKIWLARKETRRAAVAEASERLRSKGGDVVEEVLESARNRYLVDRDTRDIGDLEIIEGVLPPVPGKRFMNSLGMDFVPLPDEKVMAAVFEVRVKEFAYFVKQKSIDWQKPGFRQASSHCAIAVTYDQAVEFCDWLTELERNSGTLLPSQRYRLPTDAEWSIAVGLESEPKATSAQKNPEQEVFPWGVEWPPSSYVANLDDKRIPGFRDRFTYTSPVGGRPKNKLGISDLAGNAAEWCSDEFPPGSGSRMVRGSSWLDSSREVLQSGYRKHFPPDTSELDIGFRCFLELQ